ncbi:copper resistance CopC family protein [Nitrosomonas sp.]|uniref:copper resistance CopC family protein n=1 Tax=Nitrosomonas sp. TaxID=42353 RepID=UPI00260E10DB|nr:copper resistance CopC family protein [Nitrosomonas sp.]
MQNKRSLAFVIKRITACAAVLTMLSLLFQANSVMAHATLVKSDPPRRASLSTPPKQIQLWFNEKIEASYASVAVLDSNKKSITDNNPEVVSDNPKSVVLNIPEIESGRYTVQYRVMSVDGHVIESSFDFSVKNKM